MANLTITNLTSEDVLLQELYVTLPGNATITTTRYLNQLQEMPRLHALWEAGTISVIIGSSDEEENFVAGASVSHIYLSGANGDDANDGTTPETAVATFARVWQLMPSAVTPPFVVHIGAHGGAGYAYTPPPENSTFSDGAFVILYGDGAGQAGEDGFTEVASGVAGASTDGLQLELAVATTLDNYRHLIVEFTSGAAAGFRRGIRDNSTTICYFNAAMEDIDGAVAPAPGDSYRILQNAVRLNVTTTRTEGNSVGYQGRLASPGFPLHSLFVTVNQDVVGAWFIPQEGSHNFGFDLINTARFSLVANCAYGSDDAFNASLIRSLYKAIGRTYTPQEWHGVGLSFSDQKTFSSSTISVWQMGGSLPIVLSKPSSFYGFITAQVVQTGGMVTLRGGSCSGLRPIYGKCVVSINSIRIATNVEQAALKIKSTSSLGCVVVFNETIFEAYAAWTTTNAPSMDLEQTVALTSTSAIITNRGFMNVTTPVKFTYASATGYLLGNKDGINPSMFFTPIATVGGLLSGLSCSLFLGQVNSRARIRGVTGTWVDGIVLEDNARLVLAQASADTNVLTCTGAAAKLSGNSSLAVNGTASFLSSKADGGAVELLGGNLAHTAGTLTISNSNVAATADAIRARNGSTGKFLGGASTPISKAGGYGVNARYGGRVYFTSAPQIGAGGAGDLIVDTVAGASAAAALAASESAVANVTTNNGSLVARST